MDLRQFRDHLGLSPADVVGKTVTVESPGQASVQATFEGVEDEASSDVSAVVRFDDGQTARIHPSRIKLWTGPSVSSGNLPPRDAVVRHSLRWTYSVLSEVSKHHASVLSTEDAARLQTAVSALAAMDVEGPPTHLEDLLSHRDPS